MFNIGDKIAHPMHGAGVIDSITEKCINGVTRQYYVLKLPAGGMVVLIPVESCDAIGVRPIVSPDAAEEIIRARREGREPLILPHFTCHHLRHTFCTRLCEADINIKVIQQIMGHKDIQTTMDIYAEVSDFKKNESMVEFAKMFKDIL